jgi:serine/threonine protein phosphatase 1
MGNHEDMLLGALDSVSGMPLWLANGAWETLLSYDVIPPMQAKGKPLADAHRALLAAFPRSHRDFVESLRLTFECRPYLFVHAGVRPGISLEKQDPHDLIWIREEFLLSNANFGRIVVHGHTPAEEPEIRPNRINIDTGAVFSGRLTCLVLEGESRRFLQAVGGASQ